MLSLMVNKSFHLPMFLGGKTNHLNPILKMYGNFLNDEKGNDYCLYHIETCLQVDMRDKWLHSWGQCKKRYDKVIDLIYYANSVPIW